MCWGDFISFFLFPLDYFCSLETYLNNCYKKQQPKKKCCSVALQGLIIKIGLFKHNRL